MMEDLLSFAASITAFSVCGALFHMLLPEGQVKKAGEFLLALLMLFVILKPFLHTENLETVIPNLENNLQMEENVSDGEKIQKQTYDSAVKDSILSCLHKAGIEPENVVLKTSFTKDNYLLLEHVYIYVSDMSLHEKILDLLNSELEIPEELITIDAL